MEILALGSLGLAGLVVAGAAWWCMSGVRYVALGDSLAAGVGSLLFLGYPPRLALMLRRRWRRPVWLKNLGRFGWTSGQLLDALRADAGFRRAVAGARLITVDIGGNDLRRCDEDPACLAGALAEFRRNWEAIWAEIRRLNPAAMCLCMDLYNPYPSGHARNGRAEEWIARLNQVVADPEVLRRYRLHAVAPVHAAFRGRECHYTWQCLVGDIHPTDHGYQAIAEAFSGVMPPALFRPHPVWYTVRGYGPGVPGGRGVEQR